MPTPPLGNLESGHLIELASRRAESGLDVVDYFAVFKGIVGVMFFRSVHIVPSPA
jgi:hypothetical protein